MVQYKKDQIVTYICGDTPKSVTIAQDVNWGNLDVLIILDGDAVVVDIDCVTDDGI